MINQPQKITVDPRNAVGEMRRLFGEREDRLNLERVLERALASMNAKQQAAKKPPK